MGAAANKVMGPVEWVLLVVLAILWGGSFFFGKLALAEVPPFTIVFVRVCLAAVALHVIVLASGLRMPTSLSTWAMFFTMGALNNLIPFSLIFWGQTQIPSGLASILNSTTPLFTVVLAHFLTRDERLTANRVAGVLFGVAGVAVMIGSDALAGLGVHVLAQVAVLGAAFSYACAGIFGRRFQGTPPLITAAGQVTGTSLMMLPIMLAVDRPWTLPMPGLRTWGAMVGLALLCTAVGYVIYFRILAKAGATNLLLVTFLIPVSALLLGTWILGEQLDLKHFAGMGLIALGLGAIDGRPLRFLRQKSDRARPLEAAAEVHHERQAS